MLRKNVNFNFIMFIVAVVVAIITFVAFFFSFNKYSRNIDPLFDASSNSFETAWMTKHGLSYDVSTFATLKPDFDCEKPFNLMKKVPQFTGESAMFFRTNNLVVNVYLNDELIHFVSENGYYDGLASFSSYCYLEFTEEDIGKEIRLEIFKTPISTGYCIDNFSFGDPGNIIFNAHSKDTSLIVTGFIVMIAGFLFTVLGIVSRKTYNKHRGLTFLGIASFFIGVWFITDTLWIFNSVGNVLIIELMSHIFISASIPCLLMFIYEFFNIYHKTFFKVITAIGFGTFVLFLVLNFTDVFPYGYSNYIFHAYVLTSGIFVLVEMITYLSNVNGNKGESRIFNLGVTFFVFFSLFDIGRFYQGNEGDSSLMTRFGMFILIVTSVAVIATDIVDLLKLAIEAGKIGKIAYTDANTGLGNPAAFKEKFQQLDRMKNNYNYIGIIQFDVNNLKTINDTLGHEAGDLLIKTAAEMIDKSFGVIGNCYRVGGDEFVAITTYNHAPLVCEDAIIKFESAISQFNNNPDKPFDLRVAYGIAYYQNNMQQFQSLKEVHKLADERMYNHKRELKARYAKTAEEAIIR